MCGKPVPKKPPNKPIWTSPIIPIWPKNKNSKSKITPIVWSFRTCPSTNTLLIRLWLKSNLVSLSIKAVSSLVTSWELSQSKKPTLRLVVVPTVTPLLKLAGWESSKVLKSKMVLSVCISWLVVRLWKNLITTLEFLTNCVAFGALTRDNWWRLANVSSRNTRNWPETWLKKSIWCLICKCAMCWIARRKLSRSSVTKAVPVCTSLICPNMLRR